MIKFSILRDIFLILLKIFIRKNKVFIFIIIFFSMYISFINLGFIRETIDKDLFICKIFIEILCFNLLNFYITYYNRSFYMFTEILCIIKYVEFFYKFHK